MVQEKPASEAEKSVHITARRPVMAAATTHLEGATPLHSKASILDSTVATQTTGKSWASENGRECRSAAVSKEPLMHELPLAGFLLSPQGLSLGCNVRWHHSQHTVLHVLEDTTAQV